MELLVEDTGIDCSVEGVEVCERKWVGEVRKVVECFYEVVLVVFVQITAVSSARGLILAGTETGSLYVYRRDAEGLFRRVEVLVPGVMVAVASLCFSPDEMSLGVGYEDGLVALYALRWVRGLPSLLGGGAAVDHRLHGKNRVEILRWSPGGAVLLSGDESGSVVVTPFQRRSPPRLAPEQDPCGAFVVFGGKGVAAGKVVSVHIWVVEDEGRMSGGGEKWVVRRVEGEYGAVVMAEQRRGCFAIAKRSDGTQWAAKIAVAGSAYGLQWATVIKSQSPSPPLPPPLLLSTPPPASQLPPFLRDCEKREEVMCALVGDERWVDGILGEVRKKSGGSGGGGSGGGGGGEGVDRKEEGDEEEMVAGFKRVLKRKGPVLRAAQGEPFPGPWPVVVREKETVSVVDGRNGERLLKDDLKLQVLAWTPVLEDSKQASLTAASINLSTPTSSSIQTLILPPTHHTILALTSTTSTTTTPPPPSPSSLHRWGSRERAARSRTASSITAMPRSIVILSLVEEGSGTEGGGAGGGEAGEDGGGRKLGVVGLRKDGNGVGEMMDLVWDGAEGVDWGVEQVRRACQVLFAAGHALPRSLLYPRMDANLRSLRASSDALAVALLGSGGKAGGDGGKVEGTALESVSKEVIDRAREAVRSETPSTITSTLASFHDSLTSLPIPLASEHAREVTDAQAQVDMDRDAVQIGERVFSGGGTYDGALCLLEQRVLEVCGGSIEDARVVGRGILRIAARTATGGDAWVALRALVGPDAILTPLRLPSDQPQSLAALSGDPISLSIQDDASVLISAENVFSLWRAPTPDSDQILPLATIKATIQDKGSLASTTPRSRTLSITVQPAPAPPSSPPDSDEEEEEEEEDGVVEKVDEGVVEEEVEDGSRGEEGGEG